MTFLKHLWRKWFPVKSGEVLFKDPMIKYEQSPLNDWLFSNGVAPIKRVSRDELKKLYPTTYDPSTDEEKILRGEVESYFD